MNNVIQVLDKNATQSLAELSDAVVPEKRRPLMMVLGRKAESLYRAHFRSRENDSPNKQGFPRQHFWSGIAKATALDTSRTTAESASLVIADRAINAKIHGGTWGARSPNKFLAIPLRAEVYGTRPSANFIDKLFFLPNRSGKPGGILATSSGKTLTAFWRLVPSVTVSPDSRALPPRDQVNAALVDSAGAFLLRRTTKLAPTPDT